MKPRTVQHAVAAVVSCATITACSATADAQRATTSAALGKVVDAIAAEAQQRLGTEPFRGLPVVVRTGAAAEGAEGVLAELVRSRILERGSVIEVACPAKCFEVTLTEFVSEGAANLAAGQVLQPTASFPALPRTAGTSGLAVGQASAVLVTFAVRDANRYSARQHIVAVLAVAKAADGR